MQPSNKSDKPSSLLNRLTGLTGEDKPVPPENKEAPVQPQQVKKQVVKNYGLFHPLGVATALLVGSYLLVTIGANFWHSYQRDLEYSKTRHIDKSVVEIFQRSFIPKDRVELVIRNYDGILEKRLASKSQLKAYIKARANEIEAADRTSRETVKQKMAALFDDAFQNKDADINAYADWFFEWKRPYVILKEAISSTTSRLVIWRI